MVSEYEKKKQDLEGIGMVYATFLIHQTDGQDDLKNADIGKAVTMAGDYEVIPTIDNYVLIGKLIDLSLTDADVGKRVATVQVGGIATFKFTPGKPVMQVGIRVLGGKNGTVKSPPLTSNLITAIQIATLVRGNVLAVDEEAEECVLIL